jgi:hypothetical protein
LAWDARGGDGIYQQVRRGVAIRVCEQRNA